MSVGSDLVRFSNREAMIWDLETQRLLLMEDNLPFQCSWIITNKNGVRLRQNYYIKWPEYKMGADAARITRFQQSWVDSGDDPEYVLHAFESHLHDKNFDIWGQNILGFDVYVHQIWRRELGLKTDFSYLDRVCDTSALSRAYKMGWKPDRANPLAWQYKVLATPVKGVKTSLTVMGRELGMEVNEDKVHDASYDLEVNNFVHRKLINMVEI
jgi:hypothetical protein